MSRLAAAFYTGNNISTFGCFKHTHTSHFTTRPAAGVTNTLNVVIRDYHLHYFTLGPSVNGCKVVTHWTLGSLAKLILPKYTRKDINLLVRFSRILLLVLLGIAVSVGGPRLQVR